MSEKDGESQPASNDNRKGESQATNTQLVCRIAGISDPQRIRPLLEEGLFGVLWTALDEVTPPYSEPERSLLGASQSLVRTLALESLPWHRVPGWKHLVPELFVAHSEGSTDVVGAFYYGAQGELLAQRILFRGHLVPGSFRYEPLIGPAIRLQAKSVVIFLLRPGGHADLDPAAEDFGHWLWAAVAPLELKLGGAVNAAGPQRWQSVIQPSRWAPPPPASARQRENAWARARCVHDLAMLLGAAEGRKRAASAAKHLIDDYGGVAGLARLAPDELHGRGVPEDRLARIRAACELHRRLLVATVPQRVPATVGHRLLKYLTEQYADEPAEVRVVLLLDRNQRVVGSHRMEKVEWQHRDRFNSELIAEAMRRGASILVPMVLMPKGPTTKWRRISLHLDGCRCHVDLDRQEDLRELAAGAWVGPHRNGGSERRQLTTMSFGELRQYLWHGLPRPAETEESP